MSTVRLVRETYLVVTHQGWTTKIGVRVKDIGATIGTELFWLVTGERIATYRPGTRYGDYAEEYAAVLVDEAASRLTMGRPLMFGEFLGELSRAICSHKEVQEYPWDPDRTEEPW